MGGTFTPTIHLYKPLHNEVGYDALVNTNFDILDSQIAAISAELPLTTLGDTLYENATPAPARLPGNITATKKYLSQTGTGSISAPPAWSQIAAADITGLPVIATTGSWSDLQNATANLTLNNANFTTTFNQTSGVAWLWANTTTATSGTTNASPILSLAANYWTGSASAVDLWTLQSSLASGTNGNSTFSFLHTGSTGNAYIFGPSFSPRGLLQLGDQTIGIYSLSVTGDNFCLNGNGFSTYSVCAAHQGAVVWGTTNTALSANGGNAPLAGGAAFNFSNAVVLSWDSTSATNPANADTSISRLTVGTVAFGSLANVPQDISGGLMCTNIATTNLLGSTTVAQLATPAAPTVAKGAGSGATTWGYKVVAKDSLGNVTAVSTEGTVAAQNASLSNLATNQVKVTRVPGAWSYDIYRTTVGTSPSTTGKIATISANSLDSNLYIYDDGQSTLTAAANASSGTTAYTGTFNALGNFQFAAGGRRVTIAGFTNGANNGTFTCVSQTATTLVVNNPSGVAETHAGTSIIAGDGTTAPSANTTGVFAIPLIPGGGGTMALSSLTIGTAIGLGGSINLFDVCLTGTAQEFRLTNASGTALTGLGFSMNSAPGSVTTLQSWTSALYIRCAVTTGLIGISIGNNNNSFAATSGSQVGVAIGNGLTPGNNNSAVQFSPASGNASFTALYLSPIINQTGTASGSYTGLLVNVIETALLGTANKLLDLQSGTTGGTSVFSVTNKGTVNIGGGQIVKRVAKAANYTTTATDFVITFTATSTVTLDSGAAVAGTMYRIKLSTSAAGGSTLTITPNNSKTIEGIASDTITTLGASVDVVYDGSTNWEVF